MSTSTFDATALRKDFPIFETGIAYLDSANTSQRPRQVIAAMEAYFTRFNSNIHRAAYKIAEEATEAYEGAREKVRAYVNARSTREIVWTRGTTEAINLVAYSWARQNLREGDLVVTTVMEHHSNLVPWQVLAGDLGLRLEFVDVDEQGRLRQDQFEALLAQAPRLVAFNQVSNSLGTINPYVAMTARAKAAGATVLLDGAQGAPHLGIDVQAAGADFYAFSGHKMCGPTGVGVLWGRRELLEAMPPFMLGGDMIKAVRLRDTTYNDLPWKFEAGTQAIAEVIGLGAAVDYLSAVGLDSIQAHEQELVDYAHEALTEVEGLRNFGPPPGPDHAGVLSFDLAGVHPHDLATIADRGGVCLRAGHHCTMPLMERYDVAATARASFYLYSERSEVDRLVAQLHEAKRIFGV